MSDAYDRNAYATNAFNENECCGCGGRLSRYAVRVVHADTGAPLTRLCRRCAADLMAPPLPKAAAWAN